MTVLLDLEWIEDKTRMVPTQIAALRTDDSWNILDRFSSLFLVTDFITKRSGQVAFGGHERTEYSQASPIPEVLASFCSWLRLDDEIKVWHVSTVDALKKITSEV